MVIIFGGIVACSKILAEGTMREIGNNDTGIKNMFIGESQFSSVRTATEVVPYRKFIGILKTAHTFILKSGQKKR